MTGTPPRPRLVRHLALVAAASLAAAAGGGAAGQAGSDAGHVPVETFLRAASVTERESRAALAALADGWRPGYAAMLIDLARLLRPATLIDSGEAGPAPTIDDSESGVVRPEAGAAADWPSVRRTPESAARTRVIRALETLTGQRFGDDLRRWRRWVWARPYDPHPDYARFKGLAYARIDPRMRQFFPEGVKASIRLDEIDWGGVGVNGIPPLRYPAVVPADRATYLRDSHVVFGIEVNGEARAYPKRILAWHELATDRVGGVELTVVYCTLCGTVVPWASDVEGRTLRFGTSGLLYRSNKLMFDELTGSLWSSVEGRPVVGPLTGSDLALEAFPVVTTTWGEWKRTHPDTTVLSLDTGFRRDYGEGQAYRDYFSHDGLMFEVPATDTRLKNKAEVLALRVEPEDGAGPATAVALDVAFLERHPAYTFEVAGRRLVVVTTLKGANRAYDAGEVDMVRWDGEGRLVDRSGRPWLVTEDALVVAEGDQRLGRLPARRAFWFGWVAQYPDTLLIR